jgi:hypothetical protein
MYWNGWSDAAKAGLSTKFSCCGLKEIGEDCAFEPKFPCMSILKPIYETGDTIYAILLFMMAGFQVPSNWESAFSCIMDWSLMSNGFVVP